ncbi:cytochrome c [Paenibacillus sp. J2TS4]|uniref:c-type cytochrome n=1 Tax=Paenibacillus sp. J2TS4 TaxID=2807194 RepID=UPI001B1600DC|nr:cytochrome c [Paenibacillus sp. J2TS4]GIP35168.1 cytochrome c-550 [Paenibacillus sp. J2TS4]
MKWTKWTAVILIAIAVAGCGSKAEPNGLEASGSTISKEEVAENTIYKSNCLSCHGAQLEGNMGPALSTIGAKKSKDEIVQIIEDGKGRMSGFKNRLKEEEIHSLAEWLADKK